MLHMSWYLFIVIDLHATISYFIIIVTNNTKTSDCLESILTHRSDNPLSSSLWSHNIKWDMNSTYKKRLEKFIGPFGFVIFFAFSVRLHLTGLKE